MWCLILCSFLDWFFWSFYWVLRVIYPFLDTSPFSDIWQTCSPILKIFHFLNGVLWSTNIFILMKFTFLFLLLFFMLLLLYLRILCQIQGRAWRFTLMFSFINLIAFSSVAQSSPTLCNPMDHSTPGFPVLHQLSELTQTHVQLSRWCHPIISSSHPLLLLPSIFLSIRVFSNQFFTSGSQSIGVSALASVLLKNIQDWFPLG